MEPKHEIPENDRLDEELMDLFSAPVPSSFEEKWRSAIQREENSTMSQFSGHLEKEQKKTKRKWWKAALPAAIRKAKSRAGKLRAVLRIFAHVPRGCCAAADIFMSVFCRQG